MSDEEKTGFNYRHAQRLVVDIIYLRRIDARIIALITGVIAAFVMTYMFIGMNAKSLTIVSLVSAIGAFLVALRIKSGLTKISIALDKVAAGKLDNRLEVKGGDAISSLARNFNAMASSLEQEMRDLWQERNRIRSIHQGITDGILVFDCLGRVVSTNPAAEAAIGRLERDIIGTWDIGIPEIEELVTAADLVAGDAKVRCREAKSCIHVECPSYLSDDRHCWLQCGTYCHNEIQGTFSEKRDACERCDVFQNNGIAHTTIVINDASYAVTISPILNQQGHEEGRIAVLHDISEIMAASKKLDQGNQELALMNDAAITLSGSVVELDVILEETIDKIKDSPSVDAAAILPATDPETRKQTEISVAY